MPAKVNKKFVTMLLVVLMLLIGMMGAAWFMLIYRNDPDRRIALAEQAIAAGDYPLAAEQFRKALGKRSGDVELLYRFVDTVGMIQTSDRQQAQLYLSNIISGKRQASQLRPSDETLLQNTLDLSLHFARDLGDGNSWNDIFELTDQKLKDYPDMLTARKFHGIAQVNRMVMNLPLTDEEREIPHQDLATYLQAQPNDADALFHLALWNLVQAEYHARPGGDGSLIEPCREEAQRTAQLIRERQGDDAQATFLYVRLMQALDRREEANEALDRLEAMLLDTPQPVNLLVNVAEFVRSAHNEVIEDGQGAPIHVGVQRAVALLDAGLSEHPDDLQLRVRLSKLLMRSGQGQRALDLLKEIRKTTITATAVEAVEAFSLYDLATALYCEQILRGVDALEKTQRDAVLEEVVTLVEYLGKNARSMEGWTLPLTAKVFLARGNIVKGASTMEEAIDAINSGRGGDMLTLSEAYLIAAQCRVKLGQWGAAADHYRQLIARRPDLTALKVQLAEVYLRAQQLGEAESTLEEFLVTDPQSYPARLIKGRLRMAQERPEDAIAIFRALLDEPAPNPGNRTDALLNLAQILAGSGRRDEARQYLAADFEKDPGNVRLLQAIVSLAEDEEQAGAYKQKAREAGVDPQTLALLDIHDSESLVKHINDTVEDPFTRHMQLFNVYRQTGAADLAKAEFEQAAKINPKDPRIVEIQFSQALSQRNWEEATRLQTVARDIDADAAGGMYYAGLLGAARGRHSRAIADFQQALRTRDKFPEAWQRLGMSQLATGDLTAASASFRRALDQQPDHVASILGLAEVEGRLGNRDQALEYMRQARRLAPNDMRLLDEYLTYEQRYGDKNLALQQRLQIAEQQPDNWSNRRALALLYAEMKDKDKALALVETILNTDGMTLINVETQVQAMMMLDDVAGAMNAMNAYVAQRGSEVDANDWLLLARLRWMLGMEEASLAAFEEARAAEDPQTRPATRALAVLMQQTGHNERYIELLQELWGHDPEDHGVGQSLATALAESGKADQAQTVLDQIPEPYRQDIDTLVARATIAMARGDRGEAVTILTQAIEREPNRPTLYYQRAFVRLNSGEAVSSENLTRAELDLDKAVQLDPGFVRARRMLAQLYLSQNRVDQAIAQFQSLLDRDPRSANDRLQLANLLLAGGRWLALDTVLEDGARIFPQGSVWRLLQGHAALRQQLPEVALEKYRQALELQAIPVNIAAVIGLYFDARRLDEATAVLETYPAVVEGSAVLRAMRGRAMVYAQRQEEGRDEFRQAIAQAQNEQALQEVLNQIRLAWDVPRAIEMGSEAYPLAAASSTDVWVQLMLADIEIQTRDYDAAEARLAGIDPLIAATDPLRLRLDRSKALVFDMLGRSAEAADAYRRILEKTPDSREAMNNLAYVLCDRLDRPQEALPYAEQAVGLAPDDANVLDTLGWVQFKAGQVDQGNRTLRRALEIRPLADTYFHLGVLVVSQSPDDPAALEEARQFLELARDLADKAGRTDISRQATEHLEELANR